MHTTLLILGIVSSMVVREFRFVESNMKIEQIEEFTKVRIEGFEITDEPGAPELPVMSLKIALPYRAWVRKVLILSSQTKEITGEFSVSCSQPPVILSHREIIKHTKPNKDIYLSDKPYPEKIIEYKGSGVYDNQQICELIVQPVQYYPKSKKLVLYTRIKFGIVYEGGIKLPAKSDKIYKMVLNPDDIGVISAKGEREYFKYLIITNSPMDTIFLRLAEWKTKKGIPTKVRTVDWILSHYPGVDNAAKIRNYIKTLMDSSVCYVLLGGDTDVIPCRFAYAMTCSAGIYPGREDTMPCDLYYADLQGDWDFDHDYSYGEIEDSVDLYPDMFVGRAPVNTIDEAQKFVLKVLTYEKNPPLDYLNNGLFAAEILWTNPYTDQGIHKNQIGDELVPSTFEITKLYESLGNETPQTVMAAIRAGQNLINHDGHGWINAIGVGPGYIYSQDFDTLTNANNFGILYSIGCWTSAFDFASISESFVNSPNGGGVAYIGNSSYGWGSPGNPGFGYSDRFDSRFYHSLFKENNFHLGDALSLCKTHFIPYSREENVYRWHQYQVNLLGDPELSVWTDIPETLLVSHPQSIPLGNSRILVTVKRQNSGMAIKDALVCLMKGNESYASGYTNLSGSVFLEANAISLGNFELTVTAHNYLPRETTIPVVSGSYANYLGWIINDSLGNKDGIANPNENILLPTIIKNCGNANANNIQLKLRCQDQFVVIYDSTAYLGFMAPGDSVVISDAFGITIGNLSNGHGISFFLEITDASKTLNFFPIILIGLPELALKNIFIPSPPSMPNEIDSLYVNLKNTGYGFGHSCWARLTSFDPYISVITDSIWYGEIYPESIKITSLPFIVSISPSCPLPHLAQLPILIYSENYIFNNNVNFLIGVTGFNDNMESGNSLWTSAGINNLWHISTRNSFSPTHAWYCGQESNGQYINNMNCYIQTLPFMIDQNSVLKFYRWFNVPLYGTDGIYVIIIGDGFADTLDFIGTGGALDQRNIQSNWFEERYSLFQYPAGETIQVRIAFISDNSGVNEGFYIDDVHVEHINEIEEEIISKRPEAELHVYPNPFKDATIIKFQIPSLIKSGTKSQTSIKIYDATGRLVRQWDYQTMRQSDQILWYGDDNFGRNLPVGVYFVRLETDGYKQVKKVVLLH